MREFVESLKRLFASGDVTNEKLADLVRKNTITDEEMKYIIGQ